MRLTLLILLLNSWVLVTLHSIFMFLIFNTDENKVFWVVRRSLVIFEAKISMGRSETVLMGRK